MKKIFITLSAISLFSQICAQPFPKSYYTTLGNNNHLTYGVAGNIWAENTHTPFNSLPTTIFASGLWLGGSDNTNGVVKVALQTYPTNGHDFIAGPCDPSKNEAERTIIAKQFDKIWRVTSADISAHLLDFQDGKLDNPLPAIMAWPSKGNPFFEQYNYFANQYASRDLAPFKDVDNDGFYNPSKGDFPIIFQADEKHQPDEIFWSIFNDNCVHTNTKGTPLMFEVQQTGWNYHCSNNALLNNINFLSYKISNYNEQTIDSLFMGYFIDPDLGCYQDDGIGASPNDNAFFIYNLDEISTRY